MRKLADVEHSIAVLLWDKEVNLPAKGAAFRSQQVATLSGIAHEILTDKNFGANLIKIAEKENGLNDRQYKNIKLTLKDVQTKQKLSKEFVIRRSKLSSKAYQAWLKARKENDFSHFQDSLTDMVAIKREEAELLGYEDHPYDALLDFYEPGAKTAELITLFDDVREQLTSFVKELKAFPQVEDNFLNKYYEKDKQWQFGLEILKVIGYDFEAGRQDISHHPFTTTFSPTDVRVTTRIDENNLSNMLWSSIHEGGHALYEQGLSLEDYGLPTGKYVSLGIHESQSRLWENNVARSLSFWKTHYPKLQNYFPENLKDVSLQTFYKGINKIDPSFIRTESDELHYHFHVLIRFDIEKGLLEGSIDAKDLKEIWNAKYKEYLGLDVPDDNRGILQDIHWSHGSIGYFPTYSLGSFYAAQFFHQAKKDIPNLIQDIENGDTSQLLQWLRTNIHQHGQLYTASELCQKITGEKLNFKYFMEYARNKYSGIYKK